MDPGGKVRCGRCGTENSGVNRFCGMCGAILIKKTQNPNAAVAAPAGMAQKKAESAVVPQPAQAPMISAARPASEAFPEAGERRPSAPAAAPVNTSPTITGPSFLGLNEPANGQGGDLRGSFYEHSR
ncbi:MAG: zinc-ribbon domain-containing protein, partial [Candidatus Sulfotelmatobacter sp.]